MMNRIYDVAVIGGGPAGMTAAIYLARAGADVLLTEAEAMGGQLLRAGRVENYPGTANIPGAELAAAMEAQVRELRIPILHARATGIKKESGIFRVFTDSPEAPICRAVTLATGVRHRKLGIPGEERLTGRGISWCATCDGNFFRGKTVAVVGGGNTAVQEALELSGICKKVWLLHRREKLTAEKHLIDRLSATENIGFLPSVAIRAAIGETFLEALEIEPLCKAYGADTTGGNRLPDAGASDRMRTGTGFPGAGSRNENCNTCPENSAFRRTQQDNGKTFLLPVSGLFEAVGMIPQNEGFRDWIPTDQSGYLIAGDDCRTDIPGVYAAGDCRNKQIRQLVTAVSDGAVAALGCLRDRCSEPVTQPQIQTHTPVSS